MNGYAAQFAQIKQENFRERMNDIRDVILQIEQHLSMRHIMPADSGGDSRNGNGSTNGNGDESVILVAREILPSQAMSLGDLPIAAIVTELGGGTSHAAILARSRGIPAVSGLDGIMTEVETRRHDGRRRPRRHGDRQARQGSDLGLAEGSARVFQLQGRLFANRDLPARSAPTARRSSCWRTSTTWPMPSRPRRWGRPASGCSGPSTCS